MKYLVFYKEKFYQECNVLYIDKTQVSDKIKQSINPVSHLTGICNQNSYKIFGI